MDDLCPINIVLLFSGSNKQRNLFETAEVNLVSLYTHTHTQYIRH